jgi:hypothetical protein
MWQCGAHTPTTLSNHSLSPLYLHFFSLASLSNRKKKKEKALFSPVTASFRPHHRSFLVHSLRPASLNVISSSILLFEDSVGFWLPGEKVQTHIHLVKINFVMFGYLSPLCRCRAFDHAEAIFTEAAIPSF